MTFPKQALRKDRHQVLEVDAQEQFARGIYDTADEQETRPIAVTAKVMMAVFVGFGLVVLADWAFCDGQHLQMVVDQFRRAGAALGRGV